MLWDTHMHCYFSGDSEATPRSMVESAIKKGLAGICFTDHQDIDYREQPGLFDLDFPNYRNEILSLQEEYKNRIEICWGVELGLQPHVVEENLAIAHTYPFDFIINFSIASFLSISSESNLITQLYFEIVNKVLDVIYVPLLESIIKIRK